MLQKAKAAGQPTFSSAPLPLKILWADYGHLREVFNKAGPLACSQITQNEEEEAVLKAYPQATLVHGTS